MPLKQRNQTKQVVSFMSGDRFCKTIITDDLIN